MKSTTSDRPIAAGDAAAGAQRAMLQLGAMVFVVALGYGVGLPLLQLYLARYLGSAQPAMIAWHVGMLGGVYTFALFVFAPPWGRLSDRYGRTAVLSAAFGTFLLGTAVAALAPFWTSALVLAFGATVVLTWWGPARDGEIAAGERSLDADRD